MDDILDFNQEQPKGVFNKFMTGVLVGATVIGFVFMELHLPFADILLILGAPSLMSYIAMRVILTKAKGAKYWSALLLSIAVYIGFTVVMKSIDVFLLSVGVLITMGILQWVWFQLRKKRSV